MDTASENSQSISDVLRSTPTPIPSRRSQSRRINGRIWNQAAHPSNIRRNSHSSGIWQHGTEYIELGQQTDSSSWICDHCDSIISLARSQSTFNVSRHLENVHKILVKRKRDETESAKEDRDQETPRKEGFSALIARVNIERFRQLLVRWIVQCQIPFSAIKQEPFRDLLICLQPSIERYLIRSHTTITS